MDEDPEEIVDGLVVFVGGLVAPRGADGHVRLPGSREGRAGDVLLGGFDGSAGDDGVGLETPDDVAEALGFAIEEDGGNGAVVAHELGHLVLVELKEAGVGAWLHAGDEALDLLVVGMEPEEVVGGEVDAGSDALLAEGGEELGGDVLAVGRVHDVERDRFGIPHGEAVVVLGGEHHVAEAGEAGETGESVGVEVGGVEGLGEILVEAVDVLVACAGEGVADDDAELGIDAPVDEKAEALVAEPLEAVGLVRILNRRLGGCGGKRAKESEAGQGTRGGEHG